MKGGEYSPPNENSERVLDAAIAPSMKGGEYSPPNPVPTEFEPVDPEPSMKGGEYSPPNLQRPRRAADPHDPFNEGRGIFPAKLLSKTTGCDRRF